MQVNNARDGAPIDLNVSIICLEYDPHNGFPNEISLLHCPRCGTKLCQYTGKIFSITPGGGTGEWDTTPKIIIRCPNCSTRWMFKIP